MYGRLIFLYGILCCLRLSDLRLHKPLGLLLGHFSHSDCDCLQFAVCLRFCYVVHVMIISIDCVMSDSWVFHKFLSFFLFFLSRLVFMLSWVGTGILSQLSKDAGC